ncbi:hypothetical protein Tco_1368000 [Tanacetum coccineum]
MCTISTHHLLCIAVEVSLEGRGSGFMQGMFDSYVDHGLIKELIFDKPAAIEGPSNSEKQIPDVNLFIKQATIAVAMTEFVVESKTSGLILVVVFDAVIISVNLYKNVMLDLEVFPKGYEEQLNEADVAGSIPVDLSLRLQLE